MSHYLYTSLVYYRTPCGYSLPTKMFVFSKKALTQGLGLAPLSSALFGLDF
jgi:hypothetical protein